MWAAWDRIKAALDKQEQLREAKAALNVWIERAWKLWQFITDCDALVREAHPQRCAIAYGYWLTARDIEDWTPPTGGPLVWTAPGRGRAGESEFLAQQEAKREHFKDELKQQQKAHLKAHRADVRAAKKAAQKEKV